jgi:Uma2 family endonuclease
MGVFVPNPVPAFLAPFSLWRWRVDQYEALVTQGVFKTSERIELLEGHVILKGAVGPAHDFAVTAVCRRLNRLVPAGWVARFQQAVRLSESKPEPDASVARGDERDYATRQPGPADLGLVVEVSDSSLDRDQRDKTRIYARDRVPVYWVVNLIDRRVEVYTDPNGPGDDPRYHTLNVFAAGAAVPVVLDGATVDTIPVDELLP